jgi:hypothetical protein
MCLIKEMPDGSIAYINKDGRHPDDEEQIANVLLETLNEIRGNGHREKE